MKSSERGHARLTRSLQMLAEIEAASQTPPRVENAVMARWDAERVRRVPSRTKRAVRVVTAMAAGVTLIGAATWLRSARDPELALGPGTTNQVRLKPDTTDAYTTVAVVGGPLMANEPVRVVRMRVARSVLGELGVPSPARRGAAPAETVDIDVLVGEDGVARGVRVPISEL